MNNKDVRFLVTLRTFDLMTVNRHNVWSVHAEMMEMGTRGFVHEDKYMPAHRIRSIKPLPEKKDD